MSLLPKRARARLTLGLLAGGIALAPGCATISPQQEAQMGAQYAAEINQQLPLLQDQEALSYLNGLGRRIAQQGGRGIGYTFYIVNTPEVNAFAIPGGYVYLNRGLIERTDNMAELAGVLAHEIAHVEERHGIEQMERLQGANLGLNLAYILLGRNPGSLERAAVNVGGSAYFASHSREAEHEADRLGVELLIRAGIDPRGMTTFFQELITERKRQPSAVEQWFSTHPLTEDRIGETNAIIAQYPPDRLRGLSQNTRQYDNFKARVRRQPSA